jgi:hypothetical protein
MAKGSKPVYNARAKVGVDSEGNDVMRTIGAAWNFKEGEGMVVNLQTVPTRWDGSFILVPPKDD